MSKVYNYQFILLKKNRRILSNNNFPVILAESISSNAVLGHLLLLRI